MNSWLTVGRRDSFRFSYTEDEAECVLAGYAFGERPLMWREDPRGPHLQRRATTQMRWAYRAYDCQPSKSTQISIEDITITAALDSRITSDVVLAILAVAPDVSQWMTSAMAQPAFWDLTSMELEQHKYSGSSHADMLWEAWMLLHGVVGADVAIPHKILHRKCPSYFPLLDGNTVLAHDRGMAWSGICQDLNDHPGEFEALERWFATLLQVRSGVALERLRIHDILLWACLASNQYGALLRAGASVLEGVEADSNRGCVAVKVASPTARPCRPTTAPIPCPQCAGRGCLGLKRRRDRRESWPSARRAKHGALRSKRALVKGHPGSRPGGGNRPTLTGPVVADGRSWTEWPSSWQSASRLPGKTTDAPTPTPSSRARRRSSGW